MASAVKDVNIVKIAVVSSDDVYSDNSSSQNPQFVEFDQKKPLTSIVQELCAAWSIASSDHYALKHTYDSRTASAAVGKIRRDVMDRTPYVNEKNRNQVKNGFVLCLTYSAAKTAQDIYDNVNKGSAEEKKSSLGRLSNLAADATFAQEFINKQGLNLLRNNIEASTLSGEDLAFALQSIIMLMENGNIMWDVLEPKFICKVANHINDNLVNHAAAPQPEVRALKHALTILECVVVNSSDKYVLVDQEVPLTSMIKHLQSSDAEIQRVAITLINALFVKADDLKRRAMAATLLSRQVRNVILSNISQCARDGKAEMAHQLYVLQTLLLNLWEDRMYTQIDPQDQDAMNKIMDLRKIAFDTEDSGVPRDSSGRKQGGYAKDYKKLGFKNHTNPADDFQLVPPGILALDCMVFFAKYHQDSYTKVVLENSCRSDEHECPFAQTSIQLTSSLCEILKIGEQPTEQGQTYYAMFFTQDHPFEEFFCISIMLLNKTWKEMRATTEDLPKVFRVVTEQIRRALATNATSMESFRAQLNTLTYSGITVLWQQERLNREDLVSQAKPIVELREHITPEITELVQQQRLNYLVEGTMFMKYNAKGARIKDKFWYCRLAPNLKVFHYGECSESSSPTLEQLQNKIPVVDIRALLVGKDCPHMKDNKAKKSTTPLAFSVLLDTEQGSLDFVSPNDQVRDYWSDGINALLSNPMTSEASKGDLETLLSMDIKLRLLDTEGVKIPDRPPPVPEDPPNYEFCYLGSATK